VFWAGVTYLLCVGVFVLPTKSNGRHSGFSRVVLRATRVELASSLRSLFVRGVKESQNVGILNL